MGEFYGRKKYVHSTQIIKERGNFYDKYDK